MLLRKREENFAFEHGLRFFL